MYCKNCGSLLPDGASVCAYCGVSVTGGNSFCPHCGATTLQNATFCTECGRKVEPYRGVPAENSALKSKMTAGLLGIFVGGLGIHNFYLGYTGKAIAQIFLSFCFGIGCIWGLIEGILILCGTISTDARGYPLRD